MFLNDLKNRKDDTIMLAIVDEIEREGFTVLDQTVYLETIHAKGWGVDQTTTDRRTMA